MAQSPIGMNDVLRELATTGVLTTGAIAQHFRIEAHDARIILLSAEAIRLVYRTAGGKWAITDRGRRAIEIDRSPADES